MDGPSAKVEESPGSRAAPCGCASPHAVADRRPDAQGGLRCRRNAALIPCRRAPMNAARSNLGERAWSARPAAFQRLPATATVLAAGSSSLVGAEVVRRLLVLRTPTHAMHLRKRVGARQRTNGRWRRTRARPRVRIPSIVPLIAWPRRSVCATTNDPAARRRSRPGRVPRTPRRIERRIHRRRCVVRRRSLPPKLAHRDRSRTRSRLRCDSPRP